VSYLDAYYASKVTASSMKVSGINWNLFWGNDGGNEASA